MTEAQRALLSKARSSREEVVLLIENGYLETAVARAYYGMFYLAQALLLEKDITPSSHKHTIVAFGREFSKEEVLPRRLHAYLSQGQVDRIDADYDALLRFTEDEARQKLEQLEEFLDLARAYLEKPDG